MDLQESIIADFKKFYPDLTLKQGSELTGIQVTRFFRILNNSRMKLHEYELIKGLVEAKRPKKSKYSFNEQVDRFCEENSLLIESWKRWETYRRCAN